MKLVCLDIGGTTIKTALINSADNTIMEFHSIPTNAKLGFEEIKKNICLAIDRYWNKSDKTHIGISSAGTIDAETGDVIYATDSLPGYTGFKISQYIGNKYKCKCVAVNDACAALIGESYFGSGKESERILMLTLGTGLGVSLLQNKRTLDSDSVINLDLVAHTQLYANGVLCKCGNYGCAEQYVSATALKREYGSTDLGELFRSNDSKSLDIKRKFYSDLIEVLKFCENEYKPQLIIIGGGIIELGKYWWKEFIEYYKDISNTNLVPAGLGNKAGVVGASYNCLNGKYLYQ